MKKSFISLGAMGILALSTMANAAEIDFTYVDGDLVSFGKNKKENIDVAMCINDPSLAGMKLTSIKAYINTIDGVSNTSLWLSNDLVLESKVNVPSIGSYEVTPIPATLESANLGLLQINLPEAYIMTSEPLYIGYSMSVDENTTEGQKNPIVMTNNVNPNGLFLHMSKSVLKWMDYSQTAGGVAYIVATIEGDFPAYSLGFQNYSTIYAEDNLGFDATFSVSNKGSNAIQNLKYVYSYDGGEEQTASAELLEPVEPNIANPSFVSLAFGGISGTGAHNLKVKITEVNGQPNEATNSSIDCIVNVIPFKPIHRPLVEEYTGLWCGWCPRGFLAMEMIAEDYGDHQVSICYHNGDAMEVTSRYPVNISGFPSSTVDRLSILDPYYGSYNSEFGISINLENEMNKLAIADLELEASLDGNIVNVESNVRFIQNIDEANYQVGYVLVCNGLSDPTWYQSNYYAGESGYEGTPLEVLTTWPAKKDGLIFNDVAVDVSGMDGIPGTVPTSIIAGDSYTNSYSFNIEGNSLIQNRENLVVTAFVVDKNNRSIINANKCTISSSKIDELEANGIVVAKEFYDLSGRKIINPTSGIYVVKEIMSDGKVKTSKAMIR